MPSASIRVPSPSDLERIKQIAVDADMFSTDEVGFFDDMFGGFLDGSLAGHRWLVVDDDKGRVVAAANYAPEPFADRMWNLYFIAVAPEEQRRGVGSALIEQVERELRGRGDDVARVLIVEAALRPGDRGGRTRYRRLAELFGGSDSTNAIERCTQRSSWRFVRVFSLDTRSQPSIGRPRITATSALPRATIELASSGSTRTRAPPCPLAEMAMWPPIKNARPPNIFFSVTSGRSSSSSRMRCAKSSSYATNPG